MAIALTDRFLIVFFVVCLSVPYLYAQSQVSEKQIAVKNFQQLQPMLHTENDSVYVVNFWATWCAPCVEEIPYFERLSQTYSNEKVKVLMVSLDFPNQVDTRLIPFIEQHDMQNEVILLNDPDANSWIPKVDKNWTGAIPATLIYDKNSSMFFQKEFTFEALVDIVEGYLVSKK